MQKSFRYIYIYIYVLCHIYQSVTAQINFTPVDTNFQNEKILLAEPFRYDILFTANDTVTYLASNRNAKSKEKFDFMAYIPMDSNGLKAKLWVNHETVRAYSPPHQDGGGATILDIEKRNDRWSSNEVKQAIDFHSVGGTYNNCLGSKTPWGTILTSEEYEPHSNKEIYLNGKGIRDTANYSGYPRYQNYGWLIEVNPYNGKVIGKRWSMGRFSHEGVLVMPDMKTVYLLDDYAPGIFFKFVADKATDLSVGTLYAYQKSKNGGKWLALERNRKVLSEARDEALKLGASIFIRLEDLVLTNDGKIILSETGIDSVDLKDSFELGGQLAPHLKDKNIQDHIYKDFYGRLHLFNPKTNEITVFLEAGMSNNRQLHLSNPDNLSYNSKSNFLVIHEDINGTSMGRISSNNKFNTYLNEVYILNLNNKKPDLNDLKRILIAPLGSETTGGCWSSDESSYFLNIQHPHKKNTPPFNTDCTIAITGFK